MASSINTTDALACQPRRIVNWRRSDSVAAMLTESDGPELERALWIIAGRLHRLGGNALDMQHMVASGLVDAKDRAGFKEIAEAVGPLSQDLDRDGATAISDDLDWLNAHYCDEDSASEARGDAILTAVEALPLTAANAKLRARACGIMCDFDENDACDPDAPIYERLLGQLAITHWKS